LRAPAGAGSADDLGLGGPAGPAAGPDACWRSAVAGGSAEPGRPVTARALDLLGAFDTRHRRLTLTQLAGRADLPMATAHRLVAELAAWGALARRADGCYEVG